MNKVDNKVLKFIKVIGWLIIIWGTLILAANIPIIYMLYTNQFTPGEPYWVDGITPEKSELLYSLLYGAILIIIGFALKLYTKRKQEK